jgi:hypothetical protein
MTVTVSQMVTTPIVVAMVTAVAEAVVPKRTLRLFIPRLETAA